MASAQIFMHHQTLPVPHLKVAELLQFIEDN